MNEELALAADLILAEHDMNRALSARLDAEILVPAYRIAIDRAPEVATPGIRVSGLLRMFQAHGGTPVGLQVLLRIVARQQNLPDPVPVFGLWEPPLPPEPRTNEARLLGDLFDIVADAFSHTPGWVPRKDEAANPEFRAELEESLRRRYGAGFDLDQAEKGLYEGRSAG